ncbi:MAG: ThuA domain-containing protein [Planctomycetes bacterium]|nr:ThuA domain-containing protein [Planctomycetota bacterium]
MKPFRLALVALAFAPFASAADKPVVLEGGDGPGKGKHVVLVSGDQEYRSEETIPLLAKMLSKHHGFKCTVLFTVDPKDGTVNPNINNVPGLEALKDADLLVIFTRFLNLPDDQLKHIDDYLMTGKPVVGLRTSTHAFNGIPGKSAYAKFNNGSKEKGWEGGFGKAVLGEQWVNHHGAHGKEGTRGIVAKGQEKHPILKGIGAGDIFGTTDVYTVKLPLPGDSTPLVLGEVTETLKADSKAVTGKKNDPMMPVAWTKTYVVAPNTPEPVLKSGRVFTTTMGASQDLEWEGTRRLIVNGCFWAIGLEQKIPDKTNVALVGEFKPTRFYFKNNAEWVKTPVKPADLFK